MVSRPYKCPLCNSAFRNESGMKWHIAHRHEIPTAFDALGKDYEATTTSLREEKHQLEVKLRQTQEELDQARIVLIREQEKRMREQVERLEEDVQTTRLNQDLQKAVVAIVARDCIIKERLGIEMPNPFEKRLDKGSASQ